MSVEFFGVGGPGQIGDIKKSQKAQNGKATQKTQESDQVQFSSVLQDVNKARQTNSSMNTERAERVQALKAQIAEGSYKPDLQKVATSLLQFIIEEK